MNVVSNILVLLSRSLINIGTQISNQVRSSAHQERTTLSGWLYNPISHISCFKACKNVALNMVHVLMFIGTLMYILTRKGVYFQTKHHIGWQFAPVIICLRQKKSAVQCISAKRSIIIQTWCWILARGNAYAMQTFQSGWQQNPMYQYFSLTVRLNVVPIMDVMPPTLLVRIIMTIRHLLHHPILQEKKLL